MRKHDPDGGLGDTLVTVEIEFEAFAQHRLVHVADPTLPGRTGIGNDDIQTAEIFRDARKGRGDRSAIGHIAWYSNRDPAALPPSRRDRPCNCFRSCQVNIEERQFGARGGECFCGGCADRARCSGDRCDLADQRPLLDTAELRLFKRPVFDIESVAFGDGFKTSDRFRIGNRLDGGLGKVGCDTRVPLRTPQPEHPEAGHQHDARQRIEHAPDAAVPGIVAGEIGPVILDVGRHRGAHRAGELGGLTGHRRFEYEGTVLGADRVVRGHHASRAVAFEIGAVNKIPNCGTAAKIEEQAAKRAVDTVVLEAAGAANHRCRLCQGQHSVGQLGDGEDIPGSTPQTLLGKRDHRDHPFVGLGGIVSEGEQAVLVKDEADRAGRGVDNVRGLLREREAGHNVGHYAHLSVIEVRGKGLAVGLIDEREHGGGVGMINEFLRNECVQKSLDRRVGRRRIDEVGALDSDHLFVGEHIPLAKHSQFGEPHCRQPLRLDRRHVGARPFHA